MLFSSRPSVIIKIKLPTVGYLVVSLLVISAVQAGNVGYPEKSTKPINPRAVLTGNTVNREPTELLVRSSDWTIEPEITLNETFTDNLRLSPEGFEDSDLVTTVTPGISIGRHSRRLDLELDYNLQNLFYRNNSDLNDNFHLLLVNGTGEIWEDHLFLDLSVKNSQQNVSRNQQAGGLALDNISASDDRSSVLTYNVRPYWQQRIGNIMDVEAGYEMNEVSSDDTFNSSSEQVTVTADSGSDFSRLLWTFTFEDEEIDNEDASTTSFRTVFAEIEYLLTRKFALKGTAGYDDNEFDSNSDISGPRWNLGAVWRPSTRTSVEATAGRRFFGTDIFVEASHRSRRTEWTFTYSRIPDTTRSTLFQQQVFTNTNIFGEPIDPVTGEQALLDINNAEQTVEVLIRERFSGAVNYTLRKNIFNLTVFDETREFQLRGTEERSKRVDFSWTWLIGPRTSSNLLLSWSDNEFINRNSEFYIADYRLTRTISDTFEAEVGYRYVDSSSNTIFGEYVENRLFANLYKFF